MKMKSRYTTNTPIVWACINKNGRIETQTIRRTRTESIHVMCYGLVKENWRLYKKEGYQCIQVEVEGNYYKEY